MEIPCHVQIDLGSLCLHIDSTVLIDHRCVGGEDHGKYIHDDHTGEIEEVKLKGAHDHFDPAAQHIEEIAENETHKNTKSGTFRKYIGKQPPDLPLQNGGLIKAQVRIKGIASGGICHYRHDGRADDHIQHQVGDALVPVAIEKTVPAVNQIMQKTQLPKMILLIITGFL